MKAELQVEFEVDRRQIQAEKGTLAKQVEAQLNADASQAAELERKRIVQERKVRELEEILWRKEYEIKKLERNKQARARFDGELMKALNSSKEAIQRGKYLGRDMNFSAELYQDPSKGTCMEATKVRIKVKYPDVEMDLYM